MLMLFVVVGVSRAQGSSPVGMVAQAQVLTRLLIVISIWIVGEQNCRR